MTHLFAYGTLEIPEVMEAVTGRSWASAEARVTGFARFLLKDRIYPGLITTPGAVCSGRLYYQLDDRTLAILDAFEDEVYTRTRIEADVPGRRSLEAYAYLIPPSHRACLTTIPWDPRAFRASHLLRYLETCNTFYRDYGAGSQPGV